MPSKGQKRSKCADCGMEWWAYQKHDLCGACEYARRVHTEVFSRIPTMEEIQAERRRRGVSLRYGGW
jgi:hypothetical protein